MPNQTIDVSGLPEPFIDAIEAAIRAYRQRAESAGIEPRRVAWAANILPDLPESFFQPLPEEVLNLFDGKEL